MRADLHGEGPGLLAERSTLVTRAAAGVHAGTDADGRVVGAAPLDIGRIPVLGVGDVEEEEP